METSMVLSFKLIVATIIMMRTICLGSTVSRRDWYGHPLRFLMLASSYTLLAGGAFAWLFGLPIAVWLFASGTVTALLFDRRRGS